MTPTEVAPDLTDEEREFLAAAEAIKEAEDLPPPSRHPMEKMRDQAVTNAALARPGSARDAYDEEAAMGPPSPERLARRTREVHEAMAERAARRARQRETGDDPDAA